MLKQFAIWIATAVVLAVAPLVFSSGFAITLMNGMGIVIIFAIAYNMLLGQGGMLSFGHAVYFGIAGYCSIHFINLVGAEQIPYFPVSLVPILAGLVGMLFGVLIGFVSTRRAGTTFAMISLGFVEMATALTLILVVFFNGEEGIQTDRFIGPEPFGITYGPDIQVYYLIAVWCFISMVAMYMLTRTPFGRMSNAVRDNPERAQYIGYNTQRVRWLAFTLSSFFAGLAGGLHAIQFEHVGFETISIIKSGAILFMAYIGGIGHFVGPILGAILFTFLEGTLSGVTEAWFLYLGLLFCLIVMFAPGGLAGLVMMHEPIWKTDYHILKRMVVPYAGGITSTVVAAVGVLGLLEMLYFRSTKLVDDNEFHLFGITVDSASVMPWLACVVIAGAGAGLCRLAYPRMSESWNGAMDEVIGKMLAEGPAAAGPDDEEGPGKMSPEVAE